MFGERKCPTSRVGKFQKTGPAKRANGANGAKGAKRAKIEDDKRAGVVFHLFRAFTNPDNDFGSGLSRDSKAVALRIRSRNRSEMPAGPAKALPCACLAVAK
jgi:hypothetical protein